VALWPGFSLGETLFLPKLELRLRKDVELERGAPVLVLEGDPGAFTAKETERPQPL